MGWFDGKDKKGSEDKAEGLVPQEAISMKYVEPKYATSARTRVVRSASGMLYFKRAEKNDNGTWSVYRTEILDAETVLKYYNASLKDDGTEQKGDVPDIKNLDLDKRFAVDITKESYAKAMRLTIKEDENDFEMTFIQAMSLLANLERNVILNLGGYEYVDAGNAGDALLSEKEVFAKINDKSEFANRDFYSIEHFVKVSARESICWSVDGVPKKLNRHGRPIESGTYMVADLNQANKTRLEAIQNPPTDESLPEILREAFNGFSEKGNLDIRLKAAKLISSMDNAFESLGAVKDTLTQMFDAGEKNSSSSFLETYEVLMNAARKKFEDTHELSGAFVDKIKLDLFYVDMIVYAAIGKEYSDKIESDDDRAGYYADQIKELENKIVAVAEESDFDETLVNAAKNAIQRGSEGKASIKLLDALVDEYAKNRQAFKEAMTKDPEAAAEKSKTALTANRPAAKKPANG